MYSTAISLLRCPPGAEPFRASLVQVLEAIDCRLTLLHELGSHICYSQDEKCKEYLQQVRMISM